jgi:hypothetical protein
MRLATWIVLLFILVLLGGAHSQGYARCDAQGHEEQNSLPFSRADLQQWIEKWGHRDGLGGSAISDFFCSFALQHPDIFLEEMKDDETVFDQWLANLQGLSFTDFGGCLDRECMRLKLIGALERHIPSTETEALHKRLLDQLRSISVTVVD